MIIMTMLSTVSDVAMKQITVIWSEIPDITVSKLGLSIGSTGNGSLQNVLIVASVMEAISIVCRFNTTRSE